MSNILSILQSRVLVVVESLILVGEYFCDKRSYDQLLNALGTVSTYRYLKAFHSCSRLRALVGIFLRREVDDMQMLHCSSNQSALPLSDIYNSLLHGERNRCLVEKMI
jgi:hypothetical protein